MNLDELKLILLRLAIVLGFTMVLLLAMSGCRSIKVSERIDADVDRHDSVRTTIVDDSVRTTQTTDSERTETERTAKNEETVYIFTEAGGTYNERTGEWSGLAEVQTSRTERALRTANERLTELLTAERTRNEMLCDSVATLRDKSTTDTERTETVSTWWAWLLVGFAVGFVTPIVLKRLPYVGVLFKWL